MPVTEIFRYQKSDFYFFPDLKNFYMETEDLSKIPLFFILGRPRSGTTLLTTLFNAHPNVRIAPELPTMLFLYQRFKKVKTWDETTIRSFVEYALDSVKFHTRRVENLKIDKEFIVRNY